MNKYVIGDGGTSEKTLVAVVTYEIFASGMGGYVHIVILYVGRDEIALTTVYRVRTLVLGHVEQEIRFREYLLIAFLKNYRISMLRLSQKHAIREFSGTSYEMPGREGVLADCKIETSQLENSEFKFHHFYIRTIRVGKGRLVSGLLLREYGNLNLDLFSVLLLLGFSP